MDEGSPRRLKRPRAARACERCRLKKYKCDESHPCSQCRRSQLDCVYQSSQLQSNNISASYVQDLEKRVKELSTRLSLVEPTGTTRCSPSIPRHSTQQLQNHVPTNEDSATGDKDLPTNENEESTTCSMEAEISEVNQHTNGVEFHGSTSSVAFLGHLQKSHLSAEKEKPTNECAAGSRPSIISALHNPEFSPQTPIGPYQSGIPKDPNYYVEQAHLFMDSYFENLHFIHPFIDKENFISRVHDMWFGRSPNPDAGFLALYLSLLSLGALVRSWDEVRIAGLTRFEWSRKLFAEAQLHLNQSRFSNDVETVQCLYLMAKVCQNELNPHLAYMYLGVAIRTCLSAGFNRETSGPESRHSTSISKTWWGLFSLEIEMSFALGRPDTLGMDEYHNRHLPECDDSMYAIIPCMVGFARIIRRVSLEVYHSKESLAEKMRVALQIEKCLDTWLVCLSDKLKPNFSGEPLPFESLREPKWCRRQRLVIGIRYHNVKMLLFRPFLAYATRNPRHSSSLLEGVIAKCIDSARKTIEIIHDTVRVHTFFRTWWYNTTYIMFAASVILLRITRLDDTPDTGSLLKNISMAIEILDAMDECVVAKKSAELIRLSLKEPNRSSEPTASVDSPASGPTATDSQLTDVGYPFSSIECGFDFTDYSFEGMASLFDDIHGFATN